MSFSATRIRRRVSGEGNPVMIIVHYGHRLPANYDIGLIRKRAAGRGHLFDAIPELYFKAFLLRERGRFGAIASEYSSLYLWRKSEGFRNFLVEGRYRYRQFWPRRDRNPVRPRCPRGKRP